MVCILVWILFIMLLKIIKQLIGKFLSSGSVDEVKCSLHQFGLHCAALTELFSIELREFTCKQLKKIIIIIIALFFLIIAYIMTWALLGIYFSMIWCPLMSISTIIGFHLILGSALLFIALKMKCGAFAPVTHGELKTDLKCIQLTMTKREKH